MRMKNLYDEWTKIKPLINQRWDEVAADYANDLKHSIGRRPQKTHPKYLIFGFTVKSINNYIFYCNLLNQCLH